MKFPDLWKRNVAYGCYVAYFLEVTQVASCFVRLTNFAVCCPDRLLSRLTLTLIFKHKLFSNCKGLGCPTQFTSLWWNSSVIIGRVWCITFSGVLLWCPVLVTWLIKEGEWDTKIFGMVQMVEIIEKNLTRNLVGRFSEERFKGKQRSLWLRSHHVSYCCNKTLTVGGDTVGIKGLQKKKKINKIKTERGGRGGTERSGVGDTSTSAMATHRKRKKRVTHK